jgi:SAM-dependent methyltransferase
VSADDRIRWDRRYAGQPVATIDDVGLPPPFRPFTALFPRCGTALDLACGRGAAAVWLARRGLTVAAHDISAIAAEAAQGLARRFGCAARCVVSVTDLDEGLPPGGPVNVLLCNDFRDPRLYESMLHRLAAGGLLAISVLSEVGGGTGRYRAPAGELTRAFASLEILASGEADGRAWLLARR